jgi:hypothetical protein
MFVYRIFPVKSIKNWDFSSGLSGNFCKNRTAGIFECFQKLKICCLYFHWSKPKTIWWKNNIAACKRTLCAGRSCILGKKEVFLKKSVVCCLNRTLKTHVRESRIDLWSTPVHTIPSLSLKKFLIYPLFQSWTTK